MNAKTKHDTPRERVPTQAKPIVIHKEGAEGVIQVDRMTGQVLTPADQRPDWADGLAVALLAERVTFYTQRLGPKAAASIAKVDFMAYQDLGFVALDAEGDEVEIEADNEFRMEVVAKVLGIDRETGEMSSGLNVQAEAELDADFSRTVEEAHSIDQELREAGFGQPPAVSGSQGQQAGQQKAKARK